MCKRSCFFLHAFFILTFVLAQVSPACAFISGKSGLLEICAADGTLQSIKVSGKYDLSAYIKNKKSNPQNQNHRKSVSNSCEFCFMHSHMGKMPLPAFDAGFFRPVIGDSPLVGISYISKISYFANFQSRAPPSFTA